MHQKFKIALHGIDVDDEAIIRNLSLFNDPDIAFEQFDSDEPKSEDVDLIIADSESAVFQHRDPYGKFGSIPMLCVVNTNVDVNSLAAISRKGHVIIVFRPFDSETISAHITHFIRMVRFDDETSKCKVETTAAKEETEALAYSISHDLMAPVRAINGYTKMLIEELGADAGQNTGKMLARLQANNTKLGDMITAILDLSRIGSATINREIINMEVLARSALQSTLPPDSDAVVEIGTLQEAFADEEMLQTVWNNLISNALRYHEPNSGIKIAIGSSRTQNRVTYFIKDNGVGFNMEYAGKLFKAFQRLHSQTDFPGLGMGLAVVEKIVKKHNGAVWVDSEMGKGTTLHFSLPI